MPSKKSAPKPKAAKPAVKAVESRRFWLTYPSKLITRPLIWEMAKNFPVVFNIRHASVNEEIGIVCMELEGAREAIKAAVQWLERQKVKVEPVEISVMES
jgi:ABC-type methionine transport system ATPase subunit